jgi:hypothetical protein
LADLRNPAIEKLDKPAMASGGAAPSRWQRWRPHLVALAFYTALTLLFAWPVLTNLSVGTPGDFPVDRNQNLWNFWWFKRSLLETHTNPYHTDFLFFPYGANLYLHTFSPYNLIFGLPLQLIFGLIPTYGFIELLTFPLGGYGAYLLGRYLVKNEWGALLAGLVWSFGPYHFVELRQEQLNLLSLQWLPFFILFMFRLEKAQTRREILVNGGAAAFFYFLTLLVDYYYAIYLIMFAGLYWLWKLFGAISYQLSAISRQHRANTRPPFSSFILFTIKLAAVFIVGMLPYSPVLLATIRETGSPRYVPLDNTSTDQVHSTDLLKMFLPPAHQPWWGDKSGLWQWLGETPGGQILNNWGSVLGYVALILAIYALIKLRGLWFWVFNAVFWLVISFGPTLRFNGGSTGIPMPYRLLIKLPFIGIGRFPERFILITQFSLGIMAAYGLAHLLQRLPNRTWFRRFSAFSTRALAGVAVLALCFVESWPGVLPPPKPIVQPPFTEAIKASNLGSVVPAGPAILELPVTKHSNPDSPRMLYQIYHQRPITGGYISRDLVDPHRTANDYILYDWLEPRAPGPDIIPPKTKTEQLGLLDYAQMGFVVVYPQEVTRFGDRFASLINQTFGGADGSPVRPFYQDELARVYLVPPTPLDHPVMVLGQGWDAVESIGGGRVQRWIYRDAAEARVNIAVGPEVDLEKNYTLELQAVSPDKPRRLQVFLNGQQIGDLKVAGIPTLKLDNLKLQRGDNILALRPDPADGFYSGDPRQLRLGFLSIKLT